jgi:MoaA/NifB/PqqE/SkfB family radical SAM enzyme
MSVSRAEIRAAIGDGSLSGCLWMVPTYRCNLSCAWCLSASSPGAEARTMEPEAMRVAAAQGKELGFERLGITGGEPMLLPWMAGLVAELAEQLPVLLLTNGGLLRGERLDRVEGTWGDRDVVVQLSLDHADPEANDAERGPGAHAAVLEVVPELIRRGRHVRIATTGQLGAGAAWDRLRALVRDLGVAEEDHFRRPLLRRGRAAELGVGVDVGVDDLPPELTLTSYGAFWSPFAPTVLGGELQTDLLVTRTTDPLEVAAGKLVDNLRRRARGEDAVLGIR